MPFAPATVPTFDVPRSRASRRRLAVVVATAAVLLVPATPAGRAVPARATAPPGQTTSGAAVHSRFVAQGLWVWQDVPAARLAAFARWSGRTRLWVATSIRPTRREARNLQRLLRRVGPHVRVAALGGDPSWATHPARAMRWARHAQARTPLRDLHVDVEPYALPGHRRPARLRADYLRVLDRLARLPGRLTVDVPFWYAGQRVAVRDCGRCRPRQRSFAAQLLARTDGVTVMAYRDHARGANGVNAVSARWLRIADRVGGEVMLGVETNPSQGCPHCTYWEEGADALTAQLQRVARDNAVHRSFTGTAVHDWYGWRALLRRAGSATSTRTLRA